MYEQNMYMDPRMENTLYAKQMNNIRRQQMSQTPYSNPYIDQLPNLSTREYGPSMAGRSIDDRNIDMYYPDMLNNAVPSNRNSQYPYGYENVYSNIQPQPQPQLQQIPQLPTPSNYAPTNSDGYVSQGSYGGLPPYEYIRNSVPGNKQYEYPKDNRYCSANDINIVGRENIPSSPQYPSQVANAPPLSKYPIQPEYTDIIPAPYLVSDGPPKDQIFRLPYCSKCKIKLDTYKNSFNPSRTGNLDNDSLANRTFANNPSYRHMMTNGNYIDQPNNGLSKGYASKDYFAPNAYVPCRKRCLY